MGTEDMAVMARREADTAEAGKTAVLTGVLAGTTGDTDGTIRRTGGDRSIRLYVTPVIRFFSQNTSVEYE